MILECKIWFYDEDERSRFESMGIEPNSNDTSLWLRGYVDLAEVSTVNEADEEDEMAKTTVHMKNGRCFILDREYEDVLFYWIETKKCKVV